MTARVVVVLGGLLVAAGIALLVAAAFVRPGGCRGVGECGTERRARCEDVAERNAAIFHAPVDRAGVDACAARMLP